MRVSPELERLLLHEGAAEDRALIEARCQRGAWRIACGFFKGRSAMLNRRHDNDWSLECRLCGLALRRNTGVEFEYQYDHILHHLVDLGPERLASYLALRNLDSPAKSACFQAFGAYPSSAPWRTFWRELRKEARRAA